MSLWKLLPENPEPQRCLALGSASSAFLTTYLASAAGRRLRESPFGGTCLGSPLPPAAATAHRLAALRPAPWRNPEQIREQLATFLPESLAWRPLGEMSRGAGISAGPKLPQKALAEKESIRVGWELQVLLQRLFASSSSSPKVCLYRIWKLGRTAHPLQVARPPFPGSRTWSTPALSWQKAGDQERSGRLGTSRSHLCGLLTLPSTSLTAIPAQTPFSHPPRPFPRRGD